MEKLKDEDILKALGEDHFQQYVKSLAWELDNKYPNEFRKKKHNADREKRSIGSFFLGLVANAVHTGKIVGECISNANPEAVVASEAVTLVENLLANAVYDYGKAKLFPEEDGARINIGPKGPARERVKEVEYHTFNDTDYSGLLEGQRLVALHIQDFAKMLGIEFLESVPEIIHEFDGKERFMHDMSRSQVTMEKWLLDMKDKLEFLNKHSN